jgi:hypothetical protein
MNLAAIAQAAHRMAPSQAKGVVVFTHPTTGATARAEATGGPPSLGGRDASADDFRAATTVRQKHRRLAVLPEGLAFAPEAGQTAMWEDLKWNVLGVSPVTPAGGTDVLLYRVTLGR